MSLSNANHLDGATPSTTSHNNNNNNSESKADNVEDSESVASDESEEMIEVDEDEFDSRRAECVSDMKELESQFMKLKEELVNEKLLLIDQKLKEIEDESAEEYTVPCQKLKQNMELKLKLTTLLRDYRLNNLDHIYQYETMSIQQSLENDKALLYDKHVSRLENEISKLEECKRQLMLDYNLYKLTRNGGSGSGRASANASANASGLCDYDTTVNMGMTTSSSSLSSSSMLPANSGDSSAPAESRPGGGDNDDDDDDFDDDDMDVRDLVRTSRARVDAALSTTTSMASVATPPATSVLMPGAPFIVYSLQDYDILEDWSIIKMHNSLKKMTPPV